MIDIKGIFLDIDFLVPLARTVLLVLVAFIIFKIIVGTAKKRLLQRAKTKRQVSNVEIFSRILNYAFVIILITMALLSYGGSWTGLGLGLGLFSAALGWALQKPITGIAAWIMVVTRRPFDIGDRIIIGTVKGDVDDITLTHIYVKEVGGIVGGEENSGRIVMIPNSILFEQNIINYTSQDEFVLHQVTVAVTYESNLDKAIVLVLDAAKKHTKAFFDKTKVEPYMRNTFQASGVDLVVRYFVPAKRLQEVSSLITQEIYHAIKKCKDVEFAYPHTVVLYKKKE